MDGILSLSPKALGGYEALLEGVDWGFQRGTPLYLGWELGGVACGILAAFCDSDTVTIAHIAVTAPCRRRGIARRLLQALCESAKHAGAGRIDCVLAASGVDRIAAEGLLWGQGFRSQESCATYCFPLKALLDGPLGSNRPRSAKVVALSQVQSHQLRAYNSHIAALKNFLHPPIHPQTLLEQVSMAWVEDGKMTGCVLLAPCGADVELQWIHAQGAAAVGALLSAACNALTQAFPPETMIHVAALEHSAEGLVKRLAGSAAVETTPVEYFERSL